MSKLSRRNFPLLENMSSVSKAWGSRKYFAQLALGLYLIGEADCYLTYSDFWLCPKSLNCLPVMDTRTG